MKRIELNSLQAIYDALDKNIITPNQSVTITTKALQLFIAYIENQTFTKEKVLKQIKKIDQYKNVPYTFWQQSEDFNIKDVYDVRE